jgi:hypothetical protein
LPSSPAPTASSTASPTCTATSTSAARRRAPPGASPAPAVAHEPCEPRARGAHRRDEPRQHARQERGGEREAEHARVEPDRLGARQVRGQERDQPTQRERGHPHAGRAGDRADHELLGHQPAHHACARAADRPAQRELPHAPGRAGEREVGDVHAGGQQHEPYRRPEHEQRAPHVADERRLQRVDGERRSPVGRHAPRDRRAHPGDRRTAEGERLLGPDAVAQAGDELIVVHPPVVADVARVDRGRGPQLGTDGRRREAGRHHPHHLARDAVERDAPPHDGRIGAEALAPHAVAEQHDAVAPGAVLAGGQCAPERRPRAEQREQVGAHRRDLRERRLATPGAQRRALRRADERDADEGALGALGEGARDSLRRAAVGPDAHQPLGRLVRKRAQEHRVDDREERRVDAHAQGERARGGQQVGRRAAQRAPGVAEIGQHVGASRGRRRRRREGRSPADAASPRAGRWCRAQSARSAVIGSTRAARRAGPQAASTATASSAAATSAKVSGSAGRTA